MLETLLPPLLILLGIYVWHAALKAREQARALSHALCARAHVQLLDQTVSLQRLGIARGNDGRLHLRRRYRFELSTDGVDRHSGTLEILDGELLAHTLPVNDAATGVVSNVIELRARAPVSPPQH
jgi:hypothetical protein